MKLKLVSLRSKPSGSEDDALQQACRFLGYRPRSEAEVKSYLLGRGFSTARAEATLAKLRSLNYLDDESFARDWVRSRSEGHGYGPKKIAQELQTRGIAEALVRSVVRETFGPGAEAAKAKALLKKKFPKRKFDDPKTLRRAAALLQSYGYRHSIISDLLNIPED